MAKETSDGHSNSYFQFQLKKVINNIPTIYNQSHGANPTRNISLTLDSKRWLVVFALRVLLSNKNSLEMVNMPKMEVGIRN